MIRRLLLFALCAGSTCVAEEEPPFRTWTSTAGTEDEARVAGVSGDSVTLERKGGGDRLTVSLEQLSEADRDYLLERKRAEAATGARTVEGIDAKPGKISEPIPCGEWSYRLYLPEAFHTGRSWPVCFVMSPGGPENRALRRLPVRRDLYTPEALENFTDPAALPFERAGDFVYRPELTGRAFDALRVIFRAMCMDPHDELKRA